MRLILAALLALFAFSSIQADEVDRYVAEQMRQLHLPGVSLAVIRNGRVIKAQTYGLANVELGVPVSADTVFELGSVTKQFTAAAIMLLVEDGKIGLDDPLSKYFGDVPTAWSQITVRQLLTHTSGIKNYLGVPKLERETFEPGVTHDDIAKLFFSRLDLEFEPGQTWSYSNSGFLLLGNIIEKVSAQSYWDLIATRIFNPLGMSHTRSSQPSAVIPHRASGYDWTKGHFENREALHENAYAAGSIVSTIGDMAKWDAALSSGKVLKKSSFDLMWTAARGRNNETLPFNYGFGWFVDRYHGHRVIQHTGGTPGFSSAFYRFVDFGLTIVILTNHSDTIIDHLAIDIAGKYQRELARPLGQSDPEPDTTLKLKGALMGLLGGKPDATVFTIPMQQFLKTTTGEYVREFMAASAELKGFEFSEVEPNEPIKGERIVRYRVTFDTTQKWLSFTVTQDGKIAQIGWW